MIQDNQDLQSNNKKITNSK